MTNNQLLDFRKIPGYSSLIGSFSEKPQQILISLPRSVRLPFLAAIQADLKQTILFITSKSDRLQSMHDEFAFWNRSSVQHIFTEPTPLFYERAAWDLATRFDRIDTLFTLSKHFIPSLKESFIPPVIFSSVKSVMTKTLPRREFIRHLISLKTGMLQDLQKLVSKLVALGHEPVEIVTNGGQFSRRGGI